MRDCVRACVRTAEPETTRRAEREIDNDGGGVRGRKMLRARAWRDADRDGSLMVVIGAEMGCKWGQGRGLLGSGLDPGVHARARERMRLSCPVMS